MKDIKFIHCADIHFDTAFSGLSSSKALIRRDELRMNFSRIISLCTEKKADILMISGDLFDSTRVTEETVTFLKNSFASISNVHIFISPGNHDPYMPGSRYEDVWPSNVHIFKNSFIERVTIDELNLNVYGAAFTVPYIERGLLEEFSCSEHEDGEPDALKPFFNIMLMHGELIASGQSSTYNPISLSSISNSGLDYLALGHTHEFSSVKIAEETHYSYSGSPEGRGFDEIGEKGVVFGVLEFLPNSRKTHFSWEFIPCSVRKYVVLSTDLSGCSTHEEAILCINNVLGNPSDLYKVTLTGSLKDGFILDLNILDARFVEKYFSIKFKDLTCVEIDPDTLLNESMLRGIFAGRMTAKIEDAKRKDNKEEERFYTDALAVGLKAFHEEVPIYDNQID